MVDAGLESWVDSEAGRQLTIELVARVCKQYQVSADLAEGIVRDLLRVERALGDAVRSGQPLKQIQRTKMFNAMVSRARKNAYYALRRYDRTNPEATAALSELDAVPLGTPVPAGVLTALARGHVSTAERLADLTAFHTELFARIGSPASVLDVGCGIYPLLFPFDAQGAGVREYIAVDKDPRSVDVLERFARARGDGRLVPLRFNLAEGWAPFAERTGRNRFDVAFLFKLVPVVRRCDRLALDALLAVPTDLVVLTGAATSMTKHADITRRERAILLSFAEDAGMSVLDDFTTGQECFVVASRG